MSEPTRGDLRADSAPVDLMAALKASLERAREAREAREAPATCAVCGEEKPLTRDGLLHFHFGTEYDGHVRRVCRGAGLKPQARDDVSEDKIAATADMRIEVVRRELNQGALAGFDSAVTEYAARLVVAALDTFDEEVLKFEFRRGFELGDTNGYLRAITLLRDEAERLDGAHGSDFGWRPLRVAADYLEAQEPS